MPLPLSYTESSLSAFLETELGPVAVSLGMLDTDAILEAVLDVQALLGHAIADEDDVTKVRAFARWQGWLAALNAATSQFDVSLTGGKKFVLSQQFDMIQKRLLMAEASASVYAEAAAVIAGSGGTAIVSGISTPGPYEWSSWP